MKKLTNSLNGNLNAKISKEGNNIGFEVDLEVGGIGLGVSSEDGGTFGVDIGIVGVEINAEGGGSIEFLNGLYGIDVKKVGCSYIKQTYAGGFLVHVEVEKIPDCDPEEFEPPERDRPPDQVHEEDLVQDFPDNESGDYLEGNPDDVLVGCSVWNMRLGARDKYVLDPHTLETILLREAGTGWITSEPTSEPQVSGDGYLQTYSIRVRKSNYRAFALIDYTIGVDWSMGFHVGVDPDEEGVFGTGVFWYISDPPMEEPFVGESEVTRLIAYLNDGVGILAGTTTVNVFRATRKKINSDIAFLKRLYHSPSLRELFANPDTDSFLSGYDGWNFKIFGLYNLTHGKSDWEVPKKRPPENVNKPRKKDMKCCFTEDDRTLLRLNAVALGSENFPGVINVEKSDKGLSVNSTFPSEKSNLLDTEVSISNYLELKFWQTRLLLQMGGNSKTIEEIAKVLAVDEMLKKGLNIPRKWYTPEGKGKEQLDTYLKISEYQMRMLDHYGIAPFTAEIADSNLLKKSRQGLEVQTINGTDAIRHILQNTLKNESRNNVTLKLLGALGIALGQILKVTSAGTRLVQEIQQFLGMPVKEESFKIKMPFNLKALIKRQKLKKKGGKSNSSEGNPEINIEEDLETLLPEFIKSGEQEYSCEVYDDDYPNLIEQLTNNQLDKNGNS